ncbi:hypothetical protein AB834_06540 [PVC group bacterium (ex Bugula neritina AB1)]|nr:hypothetical protein AB834_06540 [PVC group bacterium (ex Bugula neritina AB1)]
MLLNPLPLFVFSLLASYGAFFCHHFLVFILFFIPFSFWLLCFFRNHRSQVLRLFLIAIISGSFLGEGVRCRQKVMKNIFYLLQQEEEVMVEGVISKSFKVKKINKLKINAHKIYMKKSQKIISSQLPYILCDINLFDKEKLKKGDKIKVIGKCRLMKKKDEGYYSFLLKNNIVLIIENAFSFQVKKKDKNHSKYINSYYFFRQGNLFDCINNIRNFFSIGINSFRDRALCFFNSLESFLGHDILEIFKAWVLGHREGMSRFLKRSFQKSGTYHIFAISGLHVFIFFNLILAILIFFRLPFVWATVISINLLCFFAILTGGSSSVVRASLMCATVMMMKNFGRSIRLENLFFFTVGVFAVLDPACLIHLNFQMSFLAIACIVIVGKLLKIWKRSDWHPIIKNGIDVFLMSVFLMLGMAPVMLATFGEVAWVSPLSNICVVPLMILALYLFFVILLFKAFHLNQFLFGIMIKCEKAVMESLLQIVSFFSKFQLLTLSIDNFYMYLYFYMILLFLLFIPFYSILSKNEY